MKCPIATRIRADVHNAMQSAEEIGGPEVPDYLELMREIRDDASQRIQNAAEAKFPETIAFSRAFLIVFGQVVENGYSALENITPDDEDEDPDDIRCAFDNALSETAALFSMKQDAETLGALSDIVLAAWVALDGYLIATTDR